MSFFFFQAEAGIRDGHVTGVQTCALPISVLICMTKNVVMNTAIILGSSVGPKIISRIGKMAIFGSGYSAANSGPKAALTGRKDHIRSHTAIQATAPRPPPTLRLSREGQTCSHSSLSNAISVSVLV